MNKNELLLKNLNLINPNGPGGKISAKNHREINADIINYAADNIGRGWTIQTADEIYGDKLIRKVTGYIGGQGVTPTENIGLYFADGGFTDSKDSALDYTALDTGILIRDTGKNIVDSSTVQVGKYVNYDHGTLSTNASYDAYGPFSVSPGQPYFFNENCIHIAWYDGGGAFISGETEIFSKYRTSPAGAKFLRVSGLTGQALQVEKGTTGTPFEAYYETLGLNPEIDVNLENAKFIITKKAYGKNRFNKTDVTPGKYVNAFTGGLNENAGYAASGFTYVADLVGKYITLSSLVHIAFYTAAQVYISGREYGGDTIIVPSGAVYARFSIIAGANIDTFQVEPGDEKTAYEAFALPVDFLEIPGLRVEGTENPVDKVLPFFNTPSVMYWANDRQLNIYFKSSIFLAPGSYFTAQSGRGRFLADKYRVTPAEDSTVILGAENNNGKRTKLINIKAATGSISTRKVLVIGDSTVNAGITLKEIKDYFTTSVNFIGTRESLGVKHEGRGGWTVNDYATAGRTFFKFNYASGSVSKGDVYTVNGSEYTVAEVNTGYFSAEKSAGTNAPSASGTLTRIYGSGSATIAYSSFDLVSGNPFWSGTAFSIADYLANTSQSLAADDWVFFQLGINDIFGAALLNGSFNVPDRVATMVTQMAAMVANIKAYNSGVRIGIIQTIPPAYSQDATGNLLNSAFYSSEYYVNKGLVEWWRALLAAYDTDANRSNKIYLIGAASVIDRVNNFPVITEAIDSHNPTPVKVYVNDVHPADAGYKQIADAYIGILKYFG